MRRALLAAAFVLAACADDGPSHTGTIRSLDLDQSTIVLCDAEDGNDITIRLRPDADYAFPLVHLEEHRRTGDPVEVCVESSASGLVATAIDDAEPLEADEAARCGG